MVFYSYLSKGCITRSTVQGRSYIGGAGGAAPPGHISVGKSSKSCTQSAN